MKVHVLVVDPDPLERDRVSASLRALHYDVSGCADGPGALTFVQRERVSIVVTEHRLPGLDGQALAWELSRLTRPVGVVMATRFGGPDAEERARRAGILAYVQKPVEDPRLWQSLLEAALETHRRRLGTA